MICVFDNALGRMRVMPAPGLFASISSSDEASRRAYRPTKQCSNNLLWSAQHVLRTFLAGTVLF
eukprot:5915790-Pyramimonas_sp.AAC.1